MAKKKTYTEEQRKKRRAWTKRWRDAIVDDPVHGRVTNSFLHNLRTAESRRNWLSANRDSVKSGMWRWQYGLTDAQGARALAATHCPICGKRFTKERSHSKCIDHDHDTGENRGVICAACNKLLGYARDNPVILQNAVRYLQGELRNL